MEKHLILRTEKMRNVRTNFDELLLLSLYKTHISEARAFDMRIDLGREKKMLPCIIKADIFSLNCPSFVVKCDLRLYNVTELTLETARDRFVMALFSFSYCLCLSVWLSQFPIHQRRIQEHTDKRRFIDCIDSRWLVSEVHLRHLSTDKRHNKIIQLKFASLPFAIAVSHRLCTSRPLFIRSNIEPVCLSEANQLSLSRVFSLLISGDIFVVVVFAFFLSFFLSFSLFLCFFSCRTINSKLKM